MTNKQLPDDVIADAKAAGLPMRSRLDGSNPKIWITKEGDYTQRVLKFCELQRQRERTGEAVPIGYVHKDYAGRMVRQGRVSLLPKPHDHSMPVFTTPPPPPSSRELLEKAAQAIEASYASWGDSDYDRAMKDAAKIVRALLPQEPKEEGNAKVDIEAYMNKWADYGYCPHLDFDDDGNWSINIHTKDEPEWYPTISEAILATEAEIESRK
jgi:hypothetical protein